MGTKLPSRGILDWSGWIGRRPGPYAYVDTFVIDSESRLIEGNWIANARVWYAPALHCVVQIEIKDTDGDDRRRQLIEIRKPQA